MTITQQSAMPRQAPQRRPRATAVAVVPPNRARVLGKIGLLLLATSCAAAVAAAICGLGVLLLLSAVGH